MTPDNPFAPVHSRQSFVETPGSSEALRRLDDSLGAREPFLLITGGAGVGKTALASEAVARWGTRVTTAFIAHSTLPGPEFLEEIIRRFGAEPPEQANRSKLVACVERALAEIANRNQVAVLVVDEAHHLTVEQFEELRLVVNAAQQARRPLEVVFIGPPALEARLDSPALASLRQRVSVHVKLEPLTSGETRRYLQHRASAAGLDGPGLFPRKICREIAAWTGGVPRRINALAGEALRVARAWGDQMVGQEHVQTAIAALGGFVRTGVVEDAGDVTPEEAAANAAHSSTPAPAQAPVVVPVAAVAAPTRTAPAAPVPAAAVAPAPVAAVVAPAPVAAVVPAPAAPAPAAPAKVSKPEPLPRAEVVVRAPAPSPPPAEPAPSLRPAIAPLYEESARPQVPEKHDPREWVARFVGDKGPVQIGSQVLPEWPRETDVPEPSEADAPSPGEAPAKPRGRRSPARSRSRSGKRGPLRIATAGALVAIVLVVAVVLMIRASGLAKHHAGQAADSTTVAAAQVRDRRAASDKRSSSRVVVAESHAEVSPTPHLESPPKNSHSLYTIDAGGMSDLKSAFDERDRLQQLTGFEGWVVPGEQGSREPFRVVLGAYRSEERATSAANMLLKSRTLKGVTVIPLPPRSVRQ